MLEIIAATVDDAISIEQGGADRIELVSALSEGGVTPSYGLIRHVIGAVKIPVNVMIRPHRNSFIYSDRDIACMVEDIQQAKAMAVNGVVLGVLDANGEIDFARLERLLAHCEGLEVTFHMAIDETNDIIAATKQLAMTSIRRVLSAGGKERAELGLAVLKQMEEILAGAGKRLLVGRGVNKDNCQVILQATGAQELHVGTAVRHGLSPFEGINLKAVRETIEAFKNAKRAISE